MGVLYLLWLFDDEVDGVGAEPAFLLGGGVEVEVFFDGVGGGVGAALQGGVLLRVLGLELIKFVRHDYEY